MQTHWTLSATLTSERNNAMQNFTAQAYATSAQHKDSTEVCINGDASDRENADKDYNLLTINSLYYSEKHGQWDSGWVRCECSCNLGGWEHDHKRHNRKFGLS
ncbi:hypothetical protein DPMN_158669 [Dreissena polymorpha]|uniref:Uncharacterized protein n=1 Tax=Dreissena polymorpha TaxID=45954 RepID=A0A9D4IQ10_DREPO|nr:hypothetical protein DPMN_158669 [Dreissena polymorpha]